MSRIKQIEDLVFALLFLVFFGVVLLGLDKWIGAYNPSQTFLTRPEYFPRILGVMSLVLLVCVVTSQVLRLKGAGSNNKDGVKDECIIPMLRQFTLLKTLLVIFTFIYIMKYIGFLLASVFLLYALQYILGNRRWLKMSFFTFGMIFACYLIFLKLLYIQLPRGVGIFEQFSLFFY